MASPAWLPQELQSTTSQPAAGPSSGSSTPDTTHASALGTSADDANGSVRGSTHDRVEAVQSDPPSPAAALQPQVSSLATSGAPSFSYISHATGQHFSPSMAKPIAPGNSAGEMGNFSPAALTQSQPPLHSARPSSFSPGTNMHVMAPPGPPPLSFPRGAPQHAGNFLFNGSSPTTQIDNSLKPNVQVDVSQGVGAVSSVPSVPRPAQMTSAISSSIMGTSNRWTPIGIPNTSVMPGPPGIAPSVPVSSSLTTPSSIVGSSALPKPMPTAPVLSNLPVHQHAYTPYPPLSPMVTPGPWLQPPQIGGLLRPTYTFPAAFSGPVPTPAPGLPFPSVTLPDTQPPGVTAVGSSDGGSTSSTVLDSQSAGGSVSEVQPGINNHKPTNDVDVKDRAQISELESWTAHKTEAGIVYYYNALTGESTYEKPAGFKGEPDKVTAQPTPVSWEKLAGTDWALVTTNDGKKYYYNTKTKLSSWQIPNEVTEFKKKVNAESLSEQSTSVGNADASTEKGSGHNGLNAPAVMTGGREASSLRSPGPPGSSSALDLIKKKLQDSGTPATASPNPALSGSVASELNGSKIVEVIVNSESEKSKDKTKSADGDGNLSDSSSDSDDEDSRPTKEECVVQFKEMLKERGIAPFSKWEKELPKIVFDPRFKAIPGYSARRALFEHYVRTRAEEERKEKRAALKAAVDGFKQLLDEAKEDIDESTDYQAFRKKWGDDPRFLALDRKEREVLLNERILPLRKAAQEKAQAARAAAISSFKSMLRDQRDITSSSRWSKVKDAVRDDPRYKSVNHEDREALFNEYVSELRAAEIKSERMAKAKQEEEEKLKERERAYRKRKEREEQEVERVRMKARRKEAVESYQALLVETIKDPQASWTESKPKLEKDPQGRAANPHLDQSDLEKFFREHVKTLNERCTVEFRALLAEAITAEAAAQETEDGKTVLTSWSTAKRLLKADPRYTKMPRKDRESCWRRHVEEIQRKQKLSLDQGVEKNTESKTKIPINSGKYLSGSRRDHERR